MSELEDAYPCYKSVASIYGVAKDGCRKKLIGHLWRKSGTEEVVNGHLVTLQYLQQNFIVHQMDGNEIVRGFKTIRAVADMLKSNPGTVHEYITNNKPYKGFKFEKRFLAAGEIFAYDRKNPEDTRIVSSNKIPIDWELGYGFDLAESEKWKPNRRMARAPDHDTGTVRF